MTSFALRQLKSNCFMPRASNRGFGVRSVHLTAPFFMRL